MAVSKNRLRLCVTWTASVFHAAPLSSPTSFLAGLIRFPNPEVNRSIYSNTHPIIVLTHLDASQHPASITRGETEISENHCRS